MPKTVKVRIPAFTVEVDVEAWALEYGTGTNATDVRENVLSYFDNTIRQDHTVDDGLLTVVEKN